MILCNISGLDRNPVKEAAGVDVSFIKTARKHVCMSIYSINPLFKKDSNLII